MKRLVMYFLCLCMICGLVACGNRVQQNDKSNMVNIVNASSEDIYGFGYTYYVNGTIVSSGGACNADNSAIKVGNTFPLENYSSSEGAKNVELELSVVDKVGREYPCATKISLEEMAYDIKVTGDFENGFEAFIDDEK